MGEIYYEQKHHKIHEATFEEILDDLVDDEERIINVKDETAREIGELAICATVSKGEK